MRAVIKALVLALMLGFSAFEMWRKQETGMVDILAALLLLLVLFSVVSALLKLRRSSMAQEIAQRTETWWWMVAIFMLALATRRVVSFVFLGFLCFSALREYYSLMPMREDSGDKTLSFKDRASVLLAYLAVPVTVYVAYIRWYELFIILVPVYLFLLIPILFVVQDRTEGAIKSLGAISLGYMFFVFCLGHSLFMVNIGAMLLLFCFSLTEARDLISFWVGKAFAAVAEKVRDTTLARILDARIAPSVSPKKTWAAGAVSALLVAGLSLLFLPIMPPFGGERLGYGFCALAGLLIGVLGLMGDLVFSMVKRDLNVKDSGSLLPGHGGIIDRVDSLIFTVPITFHLFYWKFF
jgi:phosphatidate cytidylyltransferase